MSQTRPNPWDYDVAVIGGGPAGSTAAGILAKRQRRVLVLEREQFPRFHIGESLLPETNEIFEALGIQPETLEGEFAQKLGASFVAADFSAECEIDFADGLQVDRPKTYQVVRSRFDQLLLDHAGKQGAEVILGACAREVEFHEDRVSLSFSDSQGGEHQVSVGALVDASGQAGFLATRLGLRRKESLLRKVALFAHYEGIQRPQGRRAGDIRVVSREDMGWVWFIPLDDKTTSVGVVLDHDVYRSHPRLEPAAALDRHLRESPAALDLVQAATRTSPVRMEGDFSYDTRAYAGDRWCLVGDSAAFLDPVFSTGVTLAMVSGQEAAEALDGALDAALARGRLSSKTFRTFSRNSRRRYRYFRRFVAGFYVPAFRDMLFHTEDRGWIYRAVVSVLTGNWRPSPSVRLGVAMFFLLVKLQGLFHIVPRVHGPNSSVPQSPVGMETKP